MLDALTNREREVLGLIGQGFTLGEIAERLHRSRKTIESHRDALGRKLGVSNRVELARIAIQAGLAPFTDAGDDNVGQLNQELREQVAKGEQAQRALQAIEAGTSAATGEAFFRSLVHHLALALEVKHAAVCELLDEAGVRARTIAFLKDGRIADNVTFEVAGTACACALHGRTAFCAGDAGGKRGEPSNELVPDAESYICTPLTDSRGRVIGILSVLHSGPMTQAYEPELMLRIFASRAAAELQRLRAEEELRQAHDALEERVQQRTAELATANARLRTEVDERRRAEAALARSEETLRSIMDSAPDFIVQLDRDGTILYTNRTFEGLEKDQVVGTCVYDWIPEPYRSEVRAAVEKVFSAGQTQVIDCPVPRPGSDAVWFRTNVGPIIRAGETTTAIFISHDITKRKRADDALRESEERFRAVCETAEDSIFIKDRDLRYVHVNPAMERLFGAEASELIGRTDEELLGAEAGAHIRATDSRVLAGETIEEEHTKPVGGIEGTFHIIKVPMFDGDGAIRGLCGIARDITARKRAEEALRESEERYRVLVEMMNQGLIVQDADRIITYVNARLCEISGFDREELIGHHYNEFTAEHDRPALERKWEERERGDKTIFELEFLRKDGRRAAVIASPQPLFDSDGRFAGSVAVITDITERKNAESALRASEELYRAIVEDQVEFITRSQSDGTITFANSAYCRYFRTEPEAMIGRTFYEFIPEPERELVRRQLAALTPETPIRSCEHRVVRPDGAVCWQQWSDRAIFDKCGCIIEIQSVGRDVTERRRAEERLRGHREVRAMAGLIAVWDWDLKTDELHADVQLADMLGFERGELEVTGRGWTQRIHPDDRGPSRKSVNAAIGGETPVYEHELRLLHKDGSFRWFASRGTVVHDGSGRAVRMLGAITDINEQKLAAVGPDGLRS